MEVEQFAREELLERLAEGRRLNADVIAYPDELLGELAERGLLDPAPDYVSQGDGFAGDDFAPDDLVAVVRRQLMKWGEQTLAISFGHRVFALAFRADVLESMGIPPPTTWEDLAAALTQLREQAAPGNLELPKTMIVQPMDRRWLADLFLARAAAYARNPGRYSALFDLQTMKPLIDEPPFVRALKELTQTKPPFGTASDDPAVAFEAVVNGQAIFAIGWPPSRQSQATATVDPEVLRRVKVAELPGSREWFDFTRGIWQSRGGDEAIEVPLAAPAGRLGSVLSHSRRRQAGWHLLVRLTGRTWSSQVSSSSSATGPFRLSQMAAARSWSRPDLGEIADDYAHVLLNAFSRETVLVRPRFPGCQRYMGALAKAVEAALTEQVSEERLLGKVAEEWNRITDELGRESQLRAYHLHLGLEP